MDNSYIMIAASELSSLSGRYSYKPADEAILSHVLKYETRFCERAKLLYIEDMEIHKPNCVLMAKLAHVNIDKSITNKTYHELFNEMMMKFPDAYEKFVNIPQRKVDVQEISSTKTSEDHNRNILTNKLIMEAGITSNDADDEVKGKIKARLETIDPNKGMHDYVLFGIAGESRALKSPALLDHLMRGNYVHRPEHSQKMVYKHVDVGRFQVKIGGKCDAIYSRAGEYIVIENKNRRNRLFDPNPQYDIDQLSAYMFLWDSPEGIIHQYHNGSSMISSYDREFAIRRLLQIFTESQLVDSLEKIASILSMSDLDMINFAGAHLMNDMI